MSSKHKSYSILALVAGMISIQSGAALAKTVFTLAGPAGITSLRLLFAAIILVIIWRPWNNLPTRKQWLSVLFYGVSLGSMNFLFYLAIARIPLGIAVALEFTGPLAIALFYSHRIKDLLWFACAAIGVVLLLPITSVSANLDVLGIIYVLAAGLFWAVYIIYGQKAGNAVHGGTVTALGMSVAALLIFPIGLFQAGIKIFSPAILPYGIAVAVFSSAIPYSLEMIGLRNLPTRTFSILMSLEPACGAVLGYLFLHEYLHWLQWAAIGLIIIASVGSTWTAETAEASTEMMP